jgi:hypothetical protein
VSTGEFDDEMIFFVRKLDSSEGINWKKTGYRCKQIESIRIDIALRPVDRYAFARSAERIEFAQLWSRYQHSTACLRRRT